MKSLSSLEKQMRGVLLCCCAAGWCLSAQVRFAPEDVAVNIDGKPFTVFHYGTDANKPYLAPLRSASGKIVTRRFPMEEVAGESHDHVHHRGLWFSFNDVNGVKFWENDPSYKRPGIGVIAVRKADWKDGEHSGTLKASMDWLGPDGKVLLREDRDMVFYSDPELRTIDFIITLTAIPDVTFGDNHDGLFAIRLADDFTARKGGKMVDAEGRSGMLNVWGKRANWVDYTAEIGGERLGVAIFDHPQNLRHPTYWHARDYGLFSANPFGQSVFDDKQEESHFKLPAGQKLVFRYRVVIHPGDATTGHVADLYSQYVGKR
jgi:hypothetical protein